MTAATAAADAVLMIDENLFDFVQQQGVNVFAFVCLVAMTNGLVTTAAAAA